MTEEYILSKGYHKEKPLQFDDKAVICRYQKSFDDEIGKKYFIDILKYDLSRVPEKMQTELKDIDAYEFEMQVTIGEGNKVINMRYFCDWTLDDVEKFAADFFDKMKINYYEIGDERHVRPVE